jgi:general secretion pathway protein J
MSRLRCGRRPDGARAVTCPRGFTLVEIIIALSIVGALLVVAFGGLRVAIGAWKRGDERAEVQQHNRSLTVTLTRAMSATYPYRGVRLQGETAVLMFKGTATSINFVTQASPFPSPIPIAFTAVTIELRGDDRPGLVVRQRLLPNYDPFGDEAKPVLEDESIKVLELSYLGDNGWQSDWDGEQEGALPRAIRIGLGAKAGTASTEGTGSVPSMTVSLGGARK